MDANNPAPSGSRGDDSPLPAGELASIAAAVREEVAAARQQVRESWLEIDGVEHLADLPGRFVYRLALSAPAPLAPDQTVTFRTRDRQSVSAVVLRADDDGLVVECQKALPPDARLLSMSFDPAFILHAAEAFVRERWPTAGPITRLLFARRIPPPEPVPPAGWPGLNAEQARAVEEMTRTPLYLLWGPPGTGKTTTLGAAIARWVRARRRVLLVSTSNAAVDVAVKAALKHLRPDERAVVVRLGTTLDPEVVPLTPMGRLATRSVTLTRQVAEAQVRLRQVRELLRPRTLSPERVARLLAEAAGCEERIARFQTEAVTPTPPTTTAKGSLTACTLARMVLDADLRASRFHVVVVDESSMAPLLFAVAASLLADERVVYAGDPKQLPPIVQSDGPAAARWLGQNVYDWLGVGDGSDADDSGPLHLLRTQYRMTDPIGGVVSRLSYGGRLRHGRGQGGPKPEFVEVGDEWGTVHYSVRDRSYYHLGAIPLVHALARRVAADDLLLLTPFRPQRSLLAAVAFDLQAAGLQRRASASTIHRAQGGEAGAVVVDLTAHDPDRPVAFFRDGQCERLLNVALSRARDRLVILGSQALLRTLAREMPYWGRVLEEMGGGIEVTGGDALLASLTHVSDLAAVPAVGGADFPALYSHPTDHGSARAGLASLRRAAASRKLFVRAAGEDAPADVITRTSTNSPGVFVAGGTVCLPYRGGWVVARSPNASRVVWRVGFSHLADDELDPAQVRRFYCPECPDGDLRLQRVGGEGWFLACDNARRHTCSFRRRLTLADAKVKVRLGNMTCPKKHPLTARQSGSRLFLGCENYPACDHAEPLSILDGM